MRQRLLFRFMGSISVCPICGNQIKKRRSNRLNKYCSRACYNLDRLINRENNPNWKDGRGITNYACQVSYRTRNKHKRNARDRVRYAIKTGKIKRLPCERCGNVRSEAHHEDYEKPLEVKWLCKKCHSKEHYKIID